MENNKSPKQRLDQLPSDNSTLEEWKSWGNRIIAQYIELKNREDKRIKEIRKLKKEIKKKQKVNGYYKQLIKEYEEGAKPEPWELPKLIQNLMFWKK
ncbi:MAG: hypothetical protein AAF267_12960 [Deinococcota bacterium]